MLYERIKANIRKRVRFPLHFARKQQGFDYLHILISEQVCDGNLVDFGEVFVGIVRVSLDYVSQSAKIMVSLGPVVSSTRRPERPERP